MTDRPLLIAFYDPRSQSFTDLKDHLEESAEELHRYEAAGASVGMLGACDITVNSYLGTQEAPEMFQAWQDARDEAFHFHKPRFFPIILILYLGGRRASEYTGVVRAKHVVAFLQRHSAARGGESVADVVSLRQLLQGPGPFALGCGLTEGSEERGAFDGAARSLHGQLIFGLAPRSACEGALRALPDSWPQVAWVDGSAMNRVKSFPASGLLNGTDELSAWLLRQRHELLEEMTPDNSHKYLDNPMPLLIFLVDPHDKVGWDRGEALLAQLEGSLVGRFQMVWSDCLVFSEQFAATGMCPVFVLVETDSLNWVKTSVESLEGPPRKGGSAQDASARLLAWLQQASGAAFKGAAAESARPGGAQAAGRAAGADPLGSPASAGAAAPPRADGGDRGSEDDEPLLQEPEHDMLQAMPEVDPSADLAKVAAYYTYALRQLLQLQVSYKARYGQHLPFDFSDLQKAQKLHRSMRSLASSPDSVRRQVQDADKHRRLRREIEWQASFEFNVSRGRLGHKATAYKKALVEGSRLLRRLFIRLYSHLHEHARAGTLGVPEAKQRAVERRSATELSVAEFVERYAKPGRPVIIADVNITEEPWTLDFFRRSCNITAAYRRWNGLRRSWGRLEDAGSLPLADFLDGFRTNATLRKWYLHDFSLPDNCPEAFGPPPYRGYTVPKYFAGDYFQRSDFDSYKHSWPSLFVGSEETQSAMHIDSGGTNFWLYLLSGRKEWRFFSRRDLINVYQSPLDPHFLVDTFLPDPDKFPLLRYAEMYVGEQEPGEIMFIPGGNPHAVRNLAPIHGISMNYVDVSNVWMYLWHMLSQADWYTFELFTDGVPHGLRSDQEPMSFGVWKSVNWKQLNYDLH